MMVSIHENVHIDVMGTLLLIFGNQQKSVTNNKFPRVQWILQTHGNKQTIPHPLFVKDMQKIYQTNLQKIDTNIMATILSRPQCVNLQS